MPACQHVHMLSIPCYFVLLGVPCTFCSNMRQRLIPYFVGLCLPPSTGRGVRKLKAFVTYSSTLFDGIFTAIIR